MQYVIWIIAGLQTALTLGNFYLRPKPRPAMARVLLFGGFGLAVAVVVQFYVNQSSLRATLNDMRGFQIGVGGGGL